MSYSKDFNRTEQDLKFHDAHERLRNTLHEREEPPTVIHGPGKRTPEETAALIRDLEAQIAAKGYFAVGNLGI